LDHRQQGCLWIEVDLAGSYGVDNQSMEVKSLSEINKESNMIPVKDEIATRETPVVNYVLIAINVIVYLFMALAGPETQAAIVAKYAMIPAHFADGVTLADLMTIFTSMFMHAGLAHLGGNMLYLWIFGDNVEDRIGHFRYLVFYLVGGVVASLAHLVTNWGSELPTVGASGAIAAVLGAYLVLFPASRIVTLIPLGNFSRLTTAPAFVFLGLWFILQLFEGVMTFGGADVSGVAFWAHVGGFVAGMVMVKLISTEARRERPLAW
jgi:membrane associated rhomboid family serine protease